VEFIYQAIRRIMLRLELYELAGIFVSIVAIITFFLAGGQLDQLKGTPGYHWEPLKWVYSYYSAFLPKAVLYGAIALLAYHLIQKKPLRDYPKVIGVVVRMFAPFCILLAIYRTLQFFIPLFNHDKDAALIRIDQWMFGTQPSLWLQQYIHPWLTNYMSFVYAFWFPMIFITIILLSAHSRVVASEFIATTLITFQIGYFIFILVPAIGPQFTLAGLYHVPLHGTVIDAIKKYNDDITIARDCFPSLHTGISVLMLIYVFRHMRKWTWLYAPMVFSIIASTIYLREHYFIDVIAGVIVAIGTAVLCPKLVRAWNLYRKGKLAVRSGMLDSSTTIPSLASLTGHNESTY